VGKCYIDVPQNAKEVGVVGSASGSNGPKIQAPGIEEGEEGEEGEVW
jgi:hypothetical protein